MTLCASSRSRSAQVSCARADRRRHNAYCQTLASPEQLPARPVITGPSCLVASSPSQRTVGEQPWRARPSGRRKGTDGERPPWLQTPLAVERVTSFDPSASAWSAAEPLPDTRPLEGDRRADVAVVGAGYTGLSAALHLAERGADVVVLDAAEPGWGGSGRNGGQVIPGLKDDPDELEKIDVNRAFKALDRVRPSIRKFWDTGALSAQMLADKEVVLGSIWNGRLQAVADKGAPLAIEWNEAMLQTQYWAVLKGARNAENAQRFIDFACQPENQAALAKLIPYGPSNRQAFKSIPADLAARLPSSPENRQRAFLQNGKWWADNRAMVSERWTQWLLQKG